MRRFAPVALALSLLLPAGAAQAQSDQDKAAARSLWSQATESLSAGRFDEAIDLASRAEALMHAPTHLIIVARAQAKLGRLVLAKETYLKIIREELAPTAAGAFRNAQQEARDELAAIEPRIASMKVSVQGAGGRKFQVKIDEQQVPDALIGVFRPIDPGQHRVTAYLTGMKPVEEAVTLGDGEKKEVSLTVPEGPLPSGVPSSSTDDPEGTRQPATSSSPQDGGSKGGGSALTWIGLGVGGLGLAGLGVGIAFTVIGGGTQGEADDLFAACSVAGCTSSQQGEITQRDADAASQKTIGVIGLVGGGALLAGGVAMTVLGLTRKPSAPQQGWVVPYVTPREFGLQGAF
ncbi:hypothetical protein [Chondromyces crocatus]|uniref:hypothetical protein n=1 Tax=Chondromyces crocatus TaxID=52 RepID=UPI001FE1C469|nr:hypothetical protein [Chondromyces crocatus]